MKFQISKLFASVNNEIGLDWLGILVGKPPFTPQADRTSISVKEIRELLGDIKSEEKILHAEEYCNSLLRREDERLDKVEGKAITLLSVTGIATGLITGFVGFILEPLIPIPKPLLILILFLIVLSLLMTILLSTKVITVGTFAHPSVEDLFLLASSCIEDVKLEYIASMYYSYKKNCGVINDKVAYLIGALNWFRNSIILLLILAIIMALCMIFSPNYVNTETIAPSLSPTFYQFSTNTTVSTYTPTIKPSITPIPSKTPQKMDHPSFNCTEIIDKKVH
jgi:hypothetical protein